MLSKAIDDAQYFLGYVFFQPNSLFTFYSLQYHVHIRHRKDYDEQWQL